MCIIRNYITRKPKRGNAEMAKASRQASRSLCRPRRPLDAFLASPAACWPGISNGSERRDSPIGDPNTRQTSSTEQRMMILCIHNSNNDNNDNNDNNNNNNNVYIYIYIRCMMTSCSMT